MSMFNIGLNVKDAMSPFFCRSGWYQVSLPVFDLYPSSRLYLYIFPTACLIFLNIHTHTHIMYKLHLHPTPDQHLHKLIIQNTDNQSITFFHIQLNNSLIHRGHLHLCEYVCAHSWWGRICVWEQLYLCMYVCVYEAMNTLYPILNKCSGSK